MPSSASDPLDTGDIVRVFGRISEMTPSFKNPGTNSWRSLKRIEGVMYRIKGRVLSVAADNDPISRLRRYFKRNIEHSGADHQDVLKALTIGDRAAIPRETNDLFVRSGTAHVLAVSGFNVSIISGFFFFVVRALLEGPGVGGFQGAIPAMPPSSPYPSRSCSCLSPAAACR